MSGALLIACGCVGIRIASELSQPLTEIGGPVRNAENATAAAMASVRDELLGVAAILDRPRNTGDATLQQGETTVAESEQRPPRGFHDPCGDLGIRSGPHVKHLMI